MFFAYKSNKIEKDTVFLKVKKKRMDMNNNTKEVRIDNIEQEANHYTLNCMRTMLFITGIAFTLNVLDIFIIENYLMWVTMGSAVISWFGSYLMVKYFNDRPTTKYILFFFMIVFITVIGVMVTYHTILIVAMPILCAVQYKNNRVVYFTYTLSVISIFIGVMGGYYYGLCDANMLALTNTVKDRYIDPQTGLLLFREPNPSPWASLPLYYAFPRALVLYAFVPVMRHVTEVISNNAVREVELRKLSEMDSMTMTYNRNKYNEMFLKVYPKMNRIGVVFWDLNGLKIINDTLGHEYGDFAISAVAASIVENLLKDAKVYRIGGDEFVVIMEDAKEADLREMIRRTNDSINRKNKASKVTISASFGFAIGAGKDIEKLVIEADANMYAEKQRQKAQKEV